MTEGAAGECAHCGLRLPRRPARARIDGRTQWCCCYGCVLALAVTRAHGDGGVAAALLVRLGVAIFFTMNVMMVTMPTYAPAIYGSGADGPLFQLLRGLGVLLATPVLVLLGGPVLTSAMGSLRSGLGVDALVVLGTFAAYGVSLASVLRGGREVYVDTACMLLVLVTLGRYLEARAKAEASAALRSTFGPESIVARRLAPREERIPAAGLEVGDRIVVGPGERFPTDGLVEQGTGGVDESMLTGESAVQLKTPGLEVFGGTCSVDGRFVTRVTRPLAESAAARIAVSLRSAMASRTAIERIADRAAAFLGPLALATATAAGVWWGFAEGPGRGVMVALAVLVVACPCALGIATPAAVSMALASAAKRGIVVRSAPALERLARVTYLVFDKTGTLTSNVPRVARFEALPAGGFGTVDLLRLAAGVEAEVPHPAARALLAHTYGLGIQAATADAAAVVPGRGVVGEAEGHALVIGTAALLAERGQVVKDPDGRWIWTAVDGRVAGRWRLEDTVDPAAPTVIRWLRSHGFRLALLTGAARADDVVPQLIARREAHCGLAPDDKVTLVRRLASTARVAMVGDGLNDAPALAAADVGIAVGRASDLARLAADVVMLQGGVGELPRLVLLARRTVRIARQNLGWAFGYNAIALALAACACLTPVVAALAMLASSATVLANARRLRPRRSPSVTVDVGEGMPRVWTPRFPGGERRRRRGTRVADEAG